MRRARPSGVRSAAVIVFTVMVAVAPFAHAAVTTFSTRPGVVPAADSLAKRARAALRADSLRAAAWMDSVRAVRRADSLRAVAREARMDSLRLAARADSVRVANITAKTPVFPVPVLPPPAVPTAALPAPPLPEPSLPTPSLPRLGSGSGPTPKSANTPVAAKGTPDAKPAPLVTMPTPPTPAVKVPAPPPVTMPAAPVTVPAAPVTVPTAPVAANTAAAKPAAGMLATPARAATPGSTRITYVAGSTAYLDAGRLEGLLAGDSVTVLREGAVVGKLRIAVVSSHRASCDTLSAEAPTVLPGDLVRFAPHPVALVAAADTGARAGNPVAARSRTTRRLRGRLGGRWQTVRTDPGDGTGTFAMSQPALDLRLDGSGLGGGHMDLSVDVRSRSTTRTSLGQSTTESFSRVYRASTTMRDVKSHRRLTLGRQSSAVLSTISLFDGALGEIVGDRVSGGVFSGMQPEPLRMGLSSDIVEHGAYVELHQKPLTERRWSTATGVVTSLQNGQPNRDFLFAQASWMSKGFMGYWTQEVDWNRGWKRDAGEAALAPTSTFLSGRVPFGERVSVNAGFDNRRNVRLYRDRETPETIFDDHYRQGAWLGASVQPAAKVRISSDVRHNGGSQADRSDAWSASAEVWRVTKLQLTLRARTSQYSGETQDTQLHSLGLGLDPRPTWHVELGGGLRATKDAFSGRTERENWESVDLDVNLARRWYLNGSFEHDHGDAGTTWQNFVGLSVRL